MYIPKEEPSLLLSRNSKRECLFMANTIDLRSICLTAPRSNCALLNCKDSVELRPDMRLFIFVRLLS